LEPGANELVQRIQRTSTQMAELITTLLELSRISKADIEFEPVSLDEVLAEALAEARSMAEDRAIEWKINPLLHVIGNRILLKQVFSNLLSNAIKFTGRVGHAVIEIGEARAGEESRLYVRDNGGLAITKRIVDRHDGHIWAESQRGRGATFYFTIGPCAKDPRPAERLDSKCEPLLA